MENMCDAFRETLRVIIIRILEWMQALLMLMRSHGGQTFTDSTGSLLLWDVGPEQQRFNAPLSTYWWWCCDQRKQLPILDCGGEMVKWETDPVLKDLCNVGGPLLKCTMCKPGGVNDRTGLKIREQRTDLHSWFATNLLQYRKEVIAEKLASGSSHFAN